MEYFSLDEQIRAEGFELLEVISNRDFVQVILKYIKDFNSGNFRLIPRYLAHKDKNSESFRDSHNLYVKKGLDIIEKTKIKDGLSEMLESVT